MLGHQLLRHLKKRHDVRVTLRLGREAYEAYRLFEPGTAFYGIDARQMDSLLPVIEDFRPEEVVNAIGIVKQRSEAKEVIPSLEINSLLPHRLALVCRTVGARLVHLSTDCVFSGRKGNYRESDQPDAEDLYGRTKLLGGSLRIALSYAAYLNDRSRALAENRSVGMVSCSTRGHCKGVHQGDLLRVFHFRACAHCGTNPDGSPESPWNVSCGGSADQQIRSLDPHSRPASFTGYNRTGFDFRMRSEPRCVPLSPGIRLLTSYVGSHDR